MFLDIKLTFLKSILLQYIYIYTQIYSPGVQLIFSVWVLMPNEYFGEWSKIIFSAFSGL